MTKKQFDNLTLEEIVKPIYDEYYNTNFKIKSINTREGIIGINQKSMWLDISWYRYENISVIKNPRVIS